jgi:hypothetical protein
MGLLKGKGGAVMGALEALLVRLRQTENKKDKVEIENLETELADLTELALVGEALLGLAHELNNSLNAMALQAAAVEMQVGESLRADLAEIRREGARAAARLRPLLQLRLRRRQSRSGVDLNEVVREVLADRPVRLDLAGDLLPVRAGPGELRRLVRLLLPITAAVRTWQDKDQAKMALEVPGGTQPPGPADLFDPDSEAEGPLGPLERLAVMSLVRQLDGQLSQEARADGTRMVILTWRTVQEGQGGVSA